MPLRRHQTAKPLGRRLVAERTQGVTRNSEAAQVLGRIMMLPIAVLREILRHLDTKVIIWDPQPHNLFGGPRCTWTGTQRMRNRLNLRRRMGQGSHPRLAWVLDSTRFSNLELSHIPTNILENMP